MDSLETRQVIQATCPDCGGPLSEIRHGELREYRCLVGHAYSPRSLLLAHSDGQERALWSAVKSLEEGAELVLLVRPQLPAALAERLDEQAALKRRQAAQIRGVLERLEPFQVE